MSARIVGLNDELDEDQGQGDQDMEALLVEPVTAPTPQPVPDALDDTVPEKYRNKTARELLDIVTNQESMIGRQGQELGDLRSTVGTLRGSVDAALALRNPDGGRQEITDEAALTDNDFALDPVDATRRMVQQETKALRQTQAELDKQSRAAQFDRDYPTAGADLHDPKFVAFVQKTPGRQRLASAAFSDTNNIDFAAAEQLWDLYNDFQGMQAPADHSIEEDSIVDTQTPATSKATPKQAPQLITGNGSGGGDSGGKKPTYSQSALNDLQANNPDKYFSDAVQRPLAIARAEGRVVDDV